MSSWGWGQRLSDADLIATNGEESLICWNLHFSFLPSFIHPLWSHHMPDEVCVLLHTTGAKFSSGGVSQEKSANGKLEKCHFSENSN